MMDVEVHISLQNMDTFLFVFIFWKLEKSSCFNAFPCSVPGNYIYTHVCVCLLNNLEITYLEH